MLKTIAITRSGDRRARDGMPLIAGIRLSDCAQNTRSVHSAHVIWLRKGMSSKVLYLHELHHYYLMQAEPDVIKL
jgi:hypothetical protein